MPTPTRKHPRARWVGRQSFRLVKWSLLGLALAVLGFALYAVIVNYRGGNAVNRIETALQDRGLLDRYPASVREADARPYRAGSSAYWLAAMDASPDPGKLPLPQVGVTYYEYSEPREQYPPEVIAAMRRVVDENPLFWELVAAARAAEPTPFGLGHNWVNPLNGLEVLGGVRNIARWMCMRAALAEAEDDGEAITEAIVAVLDLNNTWQQDPGLVVDLVRTSVDAIAYTALFDGFSRIELNTAQLDRLIEAFDRRRRSHPVVPALGDAISDEFHLVTRDVQSHLYQLETRSARQLRRIEIVDPELLEGYKPKSPATVLWRGLLLATCPGRYELRHAETLDLALANYDRLVALQDKPAARWAWLAQQPTEYAEDEDREPGDFRGMRTFYLLSTARSLISMECNLAVTVAALRVERYRVEHGRWPAVLTDATGDPPLDARGQAIRYRTTPVGVVIYNTGRNTLDEQGYYRQGVRDSAYPDADDHAAWLYDAQQRNALPPPPFNPGSLDTDDEDALDAAP